MPRGSHGTVKRPRSIHRVIEALRDDPLVIARWYGDAEDRDVCESLVRALEDRDFVVREMAVRELVRLHDLYASRSILMTLAHGSTPARLAAVEVLAEIGRGDISTFQHLTIQLTGPDQVVRLAVCRALVRLADGLNDVAAELAR